MAVDVEGFCSSSTSGRYKGWFQSDEQALSVAKGHLLCHMEVIPSKYQRKKLARRKAILVLRVVIVELE